MNHKLAVDVVLLPPDDIGQTVIDLIEYREDSVIRLNATDCLPHISLAMGVLDEKDIEVASEILSNLAREFRPLEVALAQFATHATPDGKNISEVVVEPSKMLTALHSKAMELFSSVLAHDKVEANMFYAPPKVAPVSTHWVKHYFDSKSPQDFHAHITLGEGALKTPKQTIGFTTSRLALCHLGSYCTCRKVLSEFMLA